VNLHISTKALMINFLPFAAPIFGFAFFASATPFSRLLFTMVGMNYWFAMYRMVSCGESVVVLAGR
jgi:membrane protein required for beta-lactamase induction